MKYSVPIILQTIRGILPQGCEVTLTEPGGDVDTVGLAISLPGVEDQILISGFRLTGHYPDNPGKTEPVEADMLEFRDTCSDCLGGITGNNGELTILAIQIKALLKAAGWRIADTIDDYL